MKSKAWLTIFAVVALLLVGASGFFTFSSSKKYSVSRESWDDKVGIINSLEKKVPYPNEENVETLEKIVAEYESGVEGLFESLNQFQKPLDYELQNIEFQDRVKQKVTEFTKLAAEANFDIEQEDFQLGFDAYSSSVPTPKIVPILDYELKAIDHLLRAVVVSECDLMYLFSRDLIPGEVGEPKEQENGVVHRYPVRMGIECSHKAYQALMNSISNDKDYFYIVRVLEVQNEVQEGPLKASDDDQSTIPRFENPDTGEIAGIERMTDWGYPNESLSDLTRNAEADGFVPSGRDARVLMGQEKLRIFTVIDIVRFLDPSEVKLNDASPEAKDNGRPKRR